MNSFVQLEISRYKSLNCCLGTFHNVRHSVCLIVVNFQILKSIQDTLWSKTAFCLGHFIYQLSVSHLSSAVKISSQHRKFHPVRCFFSRTRITYSAKLVSLSLSLVKKSAARCTCVLVSLVLLLQTLFDVITRMPERILWESLTDLLYNPPSIFFLSYLLLSNFFSRENNLFIE